jgi:hypothetical protein
MTSYIRLVRYPYEEPHHLDLRISAFNGDTGGSLHFYLSTEALAEWADRLQTFPLRADSVLLWEYGSERPEDRRTYYLRMRVFTVDSPGHGAIHFRFNNNEDLPHRQISEFCIRVDPAAINRLGLLLRDFTRFQHEALEWSAASGRLFESLEDPEQEYAYAG